MRNVITLIGFNHGTDLRHYRARALHVAIEQEVAHELVVQTSQNTTVQKHPHLALHNLPLNV
jgi:hypothetical protein